MLHPTRGKILVEILPDETLTKSGLILSFKKEVPHRGRIIALGLPHIDQKGREKPWGMVEGHIVHFKRVWDQQRVKNLILTRDQIYAVECEDKAYGFAEYVIVKKFVEPAGRIILPIYCTENVEKQTGEGTVVSIGRDNRMGLSDGDTILYYRTEGLSVRVPGQEEMWSLKPRAILGVYGKA